MGTEVLGFSGTKKGMNEHQLHYVLKQLRRAEVLHHGDCVGADAQADSLCGSFGIKRYAWPGLDAFGKSPSRAFCAAEYIMDPAPYYARNRTIVLHGVDGLIAAPEGPEDSFPRSGTWFTVRQARRYKRKLYIVLPSGEEINV